MSRRRISSSLNAASYLILFSLLFLVMTEYDLNNFVVLILISLAILSLFLSDLIIEEKSIITTSIQLSALMVLFFLYLLIDNDFLRLIPLGLIVLLMYFWKKDW